jgi:hypothetical protein
MNDTNAQLKKSVHILALMPDRIPYDLSQIDRKVFNALIFVAMRQRDLGEQVLRPPEEGETGMQPWFSVPIVEIGRMLTLGPKFNYLHIKNVMRKLKTVVLEFSSPSEKDVVEDVETGEKKRFKLRSLVGPVDIEPNDSGLMTVYWRFDVGMDSIILNSDRFALLRLSSITALTDPKSIALYEICARYPGAQNGSTGLKPWGWWVGALTGQFTTGPKKSKTFSEYRYFYSKAIRKAMVEINEKTEITIELQVVKEGRSVKDIGFFVKKKSAEAAKHQSDNVFSNEIPLSVQLRAKDLGVSEYVLGEIKVYPPEIVSGAVDALERAIHMRKTDASLKPLVSSNNYIKGVIKKMLNKHEVLEGGDPKDSASGQKELQKPMARPPRLHPIEEAAASAQSAEMLARFEALSSEKQADLIEKAITALEEKASSGQLAAFMSAKPIKNLKNRNLVGHALEAVFDQLNKTEEAQS